MVSLIKNQILKHLSRFTKNLSSDKINFSTFKGEGELSNLELDEAVLTDLLELPSWLQLTSAWCNRVSFRIHWTKLKSVPIFLNLDEVHVEIKTCEDLRSMTTQQVPPAYTSGTKYSFINKVIDGMSIAVNAVIVTFKSPAFIATVQMSRILVESRSPSWQRSDLRMTRLKEPDRGELLIFKELEWQTIRIEAKSTNDENLTPLRLITNQARCRITIKKRISDCFVMGCRLVLILDDLLWVLTDSQLKAALHFIDSLTGLVQKSTESTRKVKAARKLELLPEYQAQVSQQARAREPQRSALSRIFTRYDVVETSYHFLSENLDLHLCDDPGDGRSSHPDLKDGGAFQISLKHFQVDYYPYHLAIGDRKHWPKYKEGIHCQWLEQSLSSFRSMFMDLIDSGKSHTPLSRATPHSQTSDGKKAQNESGAAGKPSTTSQASSSQQESKKSSSSTPSGNPIKNYVLNQLAKLMTTCVILRINDFTLYRVTTSKRKQSPKELVSGDKARFSLPEELTVLHAEFTYYYYPGDMPFPLPPPKFYVQVNPIQIFFDIHSILWLNSFGLNLHQSLAAKNPSSPPMIYVDVKVEAIMPRIIFENCGDYPNQRDRPRSLHFQTSRALITNVRTLDSGSRADLAKCLECFQQGELFFGSDFPSLEADCHVVFEKFLRHVEATDNARPPPEFTSHSLSEIVKSLYREMLWVEAKDMWFVHLDPVWADFFGVSATHNKPVPFLDAFPLTLWVYLKFLSGESQFKQTAEFSKCVTYSPKPNESGVSEQSSIFNPGAPTEQTERPHRKVLLNYYSTDDEASSEGCSVNGVENIYSGAADVHVLAYISSLVSLQINHYQYLFLLRMLEDISEVTTILTLDSNRILKDESDSKICMGALIPQLDVTFIMPSQTPGKESSGGDVESMLPDTSSLTDVHEIEQYDHYEAGWTSPTFSKDFGTTEKQRKSGSFDNLGDHLSSHLADIPMSVSAVNCTKPAANGLPAVKNIEPDSSKPGSSLPQSSTSFATMNLPNNINVGFSTMKKGFSNLMTSLDSALKPSPDDASDSMSIKSDASSDSENFVVVNMDADKSECVDAMFRVNSSKQNLAIEVASEVIEESPSEQSLSSPCRRKDLVSMATFKLQKVELIHESEGLSSSLKVQCSSIGSEECGAIPWDEFQSKFSTRAKVWSEMPINEASQTSIKMRMDHKADDDPSAILSCNTIDGSSLRNNITRMFKDFVEVRVGNVTLYLNMSTVTGLMDLVEDEIIPLPLPMEIFLENIEVHMTEDRPPSNITSPGPVPINAAISKLKISRSVSGLYHIDPLGDPHGDLPLTHSKEQSEEASANETSKIRNQLAESLKKMRNLSKEHEELKRKVRVFEKVEEENGRLRKVVEETEILRVCLASAQEEVGHLLEEKQRLLETLQLLQEEMHKSDQKKKTWNGKR